MTLGPRKRRYIHLHGSLRMEARPGILLFSQKGTYQKLRTDVSIQLLISAIFTSVFFSAVCRKARPPHGLNAARYGHFVSYSRSRISVSFTLSPVLQAVHTKRHIYRGSDTNNPLKPVFANGIPIACL